MANKAVLVQIEIAELILAVDDTRALTDRFKLLPDDRTELEDRLADLRDKDLATLKTEGGRAAGSGNVRVGLDTLKLRLRDGFNFINALPSYEISPADRLGLFTTYGWEQGEIGDLTDARAETMANHAIAVTPMYSSTGGAVNEWRVPGAVRSPGAPVIDSSSPRSMANGVAGGSKTRPQPPATRRSG